MDFGRGRRRSGESEEREREKWDGEAYGREAPAERLPVVEKFDGTRDERRGDDDGRDGREEYGERSGR